MFKIYDFVSLKKLRVVIKAEKFSTEKLLVNGFSNLIV